MTTAADSGGVGSRRGPVRDVRVLALLGASTIAFSGIFVALSHASPATAAFFRCLYALPVLIGLATREDRRHGRRAFARRLPALLSGAFFAGDLVLWNAAIGDVGAGLATVLANIQVVLVPLLAWALLHERPRPGVLVALPISALGVVLISGVVEHGASGAHPGIGTLYGVGAGVAYTGYLLLLRRGGADPRRVAGPLCDATLVACAVSLLIGVAIGRIALTPAWPGTAWLVALAIGSQVIGWLLITASLPRLPPALGSILLTVQPAGAVALAALILGESPSVLQLVGVGLVLVGLLTVRGAPASAGDDGPDSIKPAGARRALRRGCRRTRRGAARCDRR